MKFATMVSDNYTAACAAQAAFFILISMIPLVSLVLAITTYLPFSQQDVLDILMKVIPSEFSTYVQQIIQDLYTGSGSMVISISVVAMLWSASKGVAALMDGLNGMYQLRRKYTPVISRIVAFFYTIIMLVFFAVVMSVYVVISHYYKVSVHSVFIVGSAISKLFLFVRFLMGWVLFYFFILMLFVVLPGGFGLPKNAEEKLNLSARVKSQMPGAAFCSVAWLVITRALVIYMKYFPTVSVMYGSLAGIVIGMLWLYLCMYCLFIGAIINHLLSKGYLTRVKKMLQ
jgi:membrane protein